MDPLDHETRLRPHLLFVGIDGPAGFPEMSVQDSSYCNSCQLPTSHE